MSYDRLLTRAINTPLLISQAKLEIITDRVIIPIIMGLPVPKMLDPGMEPRNRNDVTSANSDKVGIINVFDTLYSKNGGGLSGSTTYQSIQEQTANLVDRGIKNIGYYIDSPGGEGFGLFSLMDFIRNLKNREVRTFAFGDGMTTSAAYGIASATDARYATEASIWGSIAAIMTHVDTSQNDAQRGVVYTILRSKAEKALGDSHTPLSDEVRARLMANLEQFDTLFNNEVLKGNTKLTLQDILDMKGSEFMATDAHSLGLVDHLTVSLDSAIEHFMSSAPTSKKRGTTKMEGNEELQLQLKAANDKIAAMEKSHSVALEQAVVGERTRCLAVMKAGKELNMSETLVQSHIERGYTAEQSLGMMTEVRQGIEAATAIQTGAGMRPSGDAGNGEGKINLKDALAKAHGRKVVQV
jgi:ClpP class serine protease